MHAFLVKVRAVCKEKLWNLTLSVPQDFHGCTQPFFIYAQNIMVYNLTAHNYVSLKNNPNKVYIKLKGIGCAIWKCKVKSFERRFMCFRKDRRKKKKKRLKIFQNFLSSYLGITLSLFTPGTWFFNSMRVILWWTNAPSFSFLTWWLFEIWKI